jgi:hypothetical protein
MQMGRLSAHLQVHNIHRTRLHLHREVLEGQKQTASAAPPAIPQLSANAPWAEAWRGESCSTGRRMASAMKKNTFMEQMARVASGAR